MTGRSLTASIEGIEKAKKALGSNSLNQTALARELGLSRSTVTNFFRQIPIERLNFEEICTKLGLDWQDIVDITANETEIEEIENPIFKDPNFLGREEDIANINNLVNEGKKVILIKAEGGIGKTTLAENWFKIQRCDYLKLNVGTTSQTIKSLEEWLISQLKETFKITPAQNFGNMLDQLTTQLHKQKIGILIDNLEPALKNGKFIEPHQNYVDLLETLANQNSQGSTIITSREQIYEHKIFRLSTFHNYDLEGLNEKTWQEYFENKQIIIDNDSLNAMWRNYGGNAEAMSLLAADILKESKGDLKAYWQDNSEDLLRHRSLEQLVHSQFDKLKNDNSQAYNLLCRLGVYPNQDINLPKIWLECLLWDVPENKRKRVIDDLLSHCLIKKSSKGYYLHPMIRTESISRLNLSQEYTDQVIQSLKIEIDKLIASEYKLQQFLGWINEKSLSVTDSYKLFSLRMFYFYMSMYELYQTMLFPPILCDFDGDITFCEDIIHNYYAIGNVGEGLRDVAIDYGLYFSIAELSSSEVPSFIDDTGLNIAIQYTLDRNFEESLEIIAQELEQFIYEDGVTNLDSYKIQRELYIKTLREVMIKYRNIGHYLHLTNKQRKLLNQYQDANILLIDCLNYVSPEVRSYIEDTLFLPIEEIEKRPFKYQG